MKFIVRLFVVCALVISPSFTYAASDAVKCVQQQLNQLGYDAGPADGLIGGRTIGAGDAYITFISGKYEGWSMPGLSGETAALWCEKVAEANPSLANAGGFHGFSEQQVTGGLWDADCDFFSTPSRSTSIAKHDGFDAFPTRLCVDGQRVTELIVWNKTNAAGTELTTAVTFLDGNAVPIARNYVENARGTRNIIELGLTIADVPRNCIVIKPVGGTSVLSEAECFKVE